MPQFMPISCRIGPLTTAIAAAELVVLSSEVAPAPDMLELAAQLQLVVDERGYLAASREGIYVAGGVLGTVGVEAGAEQARECARAALTHLVAAPSEVSGLPAWSALPDDQRRQYVEQMLHELMQLGEQRKS